MAVRFLGWEDTLEKKMAATPVFLPGESHGWRSLVSYRPQGRKESDTTEQFNFHFFSYEEKLCILFTPYNVPLQWFKLYPKG